MTTKTISGSYFNGYVLAAKYNTLNILYGALIEGGQGLSLNHPATVNNGGRIGYASLNPTVNGITATAGTTINNQYYGVVIGYSGIFAQNAPTTVDNAWSIEGQGRYGNGVFLTAGGQVANASSGFIYGANSGVMIAGAATVANLGTIYGAHAQAIAFSNGGSVGNGSVTDLYATLRSYFSEGIGISGGAGTVTNFGTILGARGGVSLASGGPITNGAGGTIGSGGFSAVYYKYAAGIEASGAAATITNLGEIVSVKYSGVVLHDGGTVANTGTIMDDAGYFGVFVSGAGVVTNGSTANGSALIEGGVYLETSGQVSNFGTIEGNGITGLYLKTGSITNGGARDSAALIDGYYVGVRVGPSASVTNFGTMEGHGGGAPKAIEMTQSDSLIVEAGGAFIGQVLGGAGTLDLSGNVAGGTGQLSLAAGGTVTAAGTTTATTFSDFGVVEIAKGATFSTTGAATLSAGGSLIVSGALTLGAKTAAVTNDGLIETTGGTVSVTGKVSGTGSAVIDGGRLDFAAAFAQDVSFTGHGTLELARSQSYKETVTGFSGKGADVLDLDDIAFTGAGGASFSGNHKGGVLTVTDGTHTARISLEGNYPSATFVASSDGHGGTDIVAENAKASAAPPHSFVEAMAGLGASAGSHTQIDEAWRARDPLLSAPRVAIA